jgi:hypothetical protein
MLRLLSAILKSTVRLVKIAKLYFQNKNKLRVLSPRANYTDRETAACRRS